MVHTQDPEPSELDGEKRGCLLKLGAVVPDWTDDMDPATF